MTAPFRDNGAVARSALCPILVQRDDQLAVLEGALMAAHRGDGGFAVLSGEAGIGKTRLAGELASQARLLGCAVLSGACSEAELSLPFLPFVEALGNYLDAQDIEAVGARLGPARRELSQLFPQLSDGAPPEQSGDSAQAKLRLFEAIVSLLAIPAEDRAMLLVIEDVHWADDSTRELLDHLARRLTGFRSLVLVTYRSDELHRRHPFVPTLQAWRRSGLAEIVELEPLPEAGVAEMIAAILGVDEVDPELRDLMLARTEGNPFVLEEMLKEATEDGDGLRRRPGTGELSIDELRIPDTVRDAILIRLARFEPGQIAILEAAAALGRTFDYPTLVMVSEADEAAVQSALEVAIAQQLIEEQPERPGRYRWRHALTQEAIYTDTVTPRRQAIHACAADALSAQASTEPVELAHHLLGAGRFAEAVPVCMRSATDAERKAAFGEAISLLERVLPHLTDPNERARVACRIGHWLNGAALLGGRFLRDGIETLEKLGERLEAARFKVILGRCLWEDSKPDQARQEFEQARDVLATAGPSAELAMAHMRLAGLHAFELDYQGCLEAARTAVEIAERAGADFERLWALGFVGLGLLDSGEVERGFEVMDTCFLEAKAREYWPIAGNVAWNDIWTRTHMMEGELEGRLERFEATPASPVNRASLAIAVSYVKKVRGELRAALGEAEKAGEAFDRLGYRKMGWRCEVQRADVLVELGRYEEALAALPPPSTRTELQDIVYDGSARIRLRLARDEPSEARELAAEILAHVDALGVYRETLALAVEAFVAAGELGDAAVLVDRARAHPTTAGAPFLDEMEGRLSLARGDGAGALPHLRRVIEEAQQRGFPLVELRARVLLAEALGREQELDQAARELEIVAEAADLAEARLIREQAGAVADSLGVSLPPAAEVALERGPQPGFVAQGERLVTSLFADVRGYTELSAASPPDELAERMAALFRFARIAVEQQAGVVDKFAGDAVMATFNVSGARVDHCLQALEAAFTLRDRAALMDLPLGIGIAVGPAVLGRGASDQNVSVRGIATNLAARLQASAGANEILLSADAHRRVQSRLAERRVPAEREELTLKGFDEPQVAYRIAAQPREPRAGVSRRG
jgi:class 3 adenylate cyclase